MNDAPDLTAVTQVQQQIWSKGDFAMVASLVYNASENLAEALEIVPDERVLDVACGSGNGAIAAARRTWGGTVGADYVPALLERGRERAAAERLEVEFVEADAQDLPFEDASFDVAISIFGAMFAPDQQKTAAELLRVVKPGGRIGMGNWTPDGAVGHDVQDDRQARPAAARARLAAALGHRGAASASCSATGSPTCGSSAASRASPSAPPTTTSSSSAPTSARPRWPTNGSAPRAKQALTDDLRAFLEAANTAGDRAMVLEAEYLEVIATRA